MKTIKKLILLALISVITFSCDDRLDILPEDQLDSDVIFTSLPALNGAVVGIYSLNQSGDLNGMLQLTQDFMADDVNFVGSFTSLQAIDQYNTLSTNASLDNIWIDAYQVIGAANNIIVNLPRVNSSNVDGLTDELKEQFIGEAKFMRALTNFQMVNAFAQPYQFSSGTNLGIPLVFDSFSAASTISDFQLERSTVNQVHTQIINDLTDAIAALPAANGSRVRATSTAAKALLARLYLYRENWPMAATLANEVLNETSVDLAESYNFYDNVTNSPELIFVVINTATDGPQETAGSDEVYTTFYNPAPGGRGDAPFSQDLVDAYNSTPDDKRFTELSILARAASGNDSFFTTKYPDDENNASNGMVLRTTEMVLIRAEANLRGATTIGSAPLADVNSLRQRAGIPDLTTVTLDDILVERRKELCFEGHRRMDLLRNNRNLRPDNDPKSAPGANKVIFPIVDDEMDNNPNITQNPGYGS